MPAFIKLPAGTSLARHVCGLDCEIGEPDTRWAGYIWARYVDGYAVSMHGDEMTGGWPASHFKPLTLNARELLRLAKGSR